MNVLAISLAFPPLAYPRSIQVARLLRHIEGVSTVLFCAAEPGARLDPTIEPDAESTLFDCLRVPVPSTTRGLTDRILYRFARRFWNRRHLVPDGYSAWGENVLERIGRYIDDTGFSPDVLVTFAQPFTDHLIGLELKRQLGVPWLAHFSDPWVDNPFTAFDEMTKAANLKLEAAVAAEADALVFTSAETVDLFYRKYPAELRSKAKVLPQCYDPNQFASRSYERSGPTTIRYLGNFYGGRSPRPLLAGLDRIYKSDPKLLNGVRFELIGAGNAAEVEAMASSLPKDLVFVRNSVNYIDSLGLMVSSDGLLVIDAPAEKSVFLPSKLIDYIGAGRPVFGITPRGTAADLIEELGGSVADPSNTENVANGLSRFIHELAARRDRTCDRPWGDPQVRDRFTTERVSRGFLKILEDLRI